MSETRAELPYMTERAAVCVVRGGLREAIKLLDDPNMPSSVENAQRIIDHCAAILRPHTTRGV